MGVAPCAQNRKGADLEFPPTASRDVSQKPRGGVLSSRSPFLQDTVKKAAPSALGPLKAFTNSVARLG